MAAHMPLSLKESVAVEELRACYNACIQRRLARGDLSIRTPQGFQRLQQKYQPRLRFSIDAVRHTGDDSEDAQTKIDSTKLDEIVGVYFDLTVSRMIADDCWPLAHFNSSSTSEEMLPKGQELRLEKYLVFTIRLFQWIFPGLPYNEAADFAQYDWNSDRELDEFGHDGLNLRGFTLSLIDLAVACNNGTVTKCHEFLQLITRWMQYPPTANAAEPTLAPIMWQVIPLSTLVPCQISSEGLYCELKAKISAAPMAIMVMASNENPIQLQLATSAKLLVPEGGFHTDRSGKTPTCDAKHEKQTCWTFTNFGFNTPSLIVAPSSAINHRSKALYARFCALDNNNQDVESRTKAGEFSRGSMTLAAKYRDMHSDPQSKMPRLDPSLVALFTSVLEPISLQSGSENGKCLRIDRMSARTFNIVRSERDGKSFSVTLVASLLHNTDSAGGRGAAVVVSSVTEAESSFTIKDSDTSTGSQEIDTKAIDAHTFVFIVKIPEMSPAALHQQEATLPRQWFTSLNAATEKKIIEIEPTFEESASVARKGDDIIGDSETEESPANGLKLFQLFIFTIHGINVDVSCSSRSLSQENGARAENCAVTLDQRSTEISLEPATLCVEDNETEDDTTFNISEWPTTSAELLRELLLLQKKRQRQSASQPPPDLLVGTKVSTSKPVTTAETLRTKILDARQLERRARFLQLEAAIREKLLANRANQRSTSSTQELESIIVASPPSPNSELETRVNLLTTFFHEMAVHQPRIDELHGSAAEEAEAAAEQQLLKRFGDIFERDVDLHNALDEEKWSTDKAKITSRRSSIKTNLPKEMLVGDTSAPHEHEDDSNGSMWTFEDYENTAQYIEQLMLDIANKEKQQQEEQTLVDTDRKDAVLKQLIISWEYTNHRTGRPATRQRLRELEQKRRSEWMQSQHIQMQGAVATVRRGDKPDRPAIILPKQPFLVQKYSLPSNAIWEVPSSPSNQTPLLISGGLAAAGFVNPATVDISHADETHNKTMKLCPRRPNQSGVVTSTNRPCDITALRSAAFSRARVHRIRSAHSHPPGSPRTIQHQTRPMTSVQSPRDLPKPVVSSSKEKTILFDIPISLLDLPISSPPSDDGDDSKMYVPQNISRPLCDSNNAEPAELEIGAVVSIMPEVEKTLDSLMVRGAKETIAEDTTTKDAFRRRRKKTRAAPPNIVRFRRSVMELASLPAKLRAAANEDMTQPQGFDALSSISLLLSSQSVKSKRSLRP